MENQKVDQALSILGSLIDMSLSAGVIKSRTDAANVINSHQTLVEALNAKPAMIPSQKPEEGKK